MPVERPEDFYRTYAAYKGYETPRLKPKHVRWYDREFWRPARCTTAMSMVELGSGTGEFLAYLRHKGVERFRGVEQDEKAIDAMPDGLADHVHAGDIAEYLDGTDDGPFDRVVLFDVLEHFTAVDGARLLERVGARLAPDGLVVVRVPNMGSPWGSIHQFSDLTHRAAYTAGSLEQIALATGFEAERFLAQKRGSPFRRVAEDALHCVLSAILATPPRVWTPNIIAVFRRRG